MTNEPTADEPTTGGPTPRDPAPGNLTSGGGTPDPAVDAWHRFCDRLAALGDEILSDDYPGSPRARAEGVRHLATQAVGWLSWAVGHADATHPAFFRQNDLVVRWGGPNVDQTTRRARLDPTGTYRITGKMHACEDFVLTVKNGDMHQERYGILTEVTASELGIAEGDDFEIVLGGPAKPDRWIELHRDATMVNIREYYFDWRPAEPATITIERLDTRGNGGTVLTAAAIADQLDDAATTIEHSIRYWNRWVEERRASIGTNVLGPPGGTAGGSRAIAYSFGFWSLADEEVLLFESDAPDAAFWDLQLYTLGWFETPDFANHVTSANHTQAGLDDDGRLRVVIGARDPGRRNWLDTEGRPEGMITYRWIRPRTTPTASTASLRKVRLDELDDLLGDRSEKIAPDERAAQVAVRQAHIAWRYRS